MSTGLRTTNVFGAPHPATHILSPVGERHQCPQCVKSPSLSKTTWSAATSENLNLRLEAAINLGVSAKVK